MAQKKLYSKLLNEAISSVAKRQSANIAAVEATIAELLSLSPHTVQSYRLRGTMPPEVRDTVTMVRYCVAHGRVDREWASSLLTQAGYPSAQPLLQELFPEQPPRREIPYTFQNLPSPTGEFLGREETMARTFEGLDSRSPITAIVGLGGTGKTTLAVEVGRRCLVSPNTALIAPFEAVVWVSAKDKPEQTRWQDEVLNELARVLDRPGIRQLALDEKLRRIEELLSTHRVLLILDNYESMEDPDLKDWMERVPAPSKVLLTSKFVQTQGVWLVHLRGLDEGDALNLIRRYARRLELVDAEMARDADLLPLARATEGNPKAIEMALGHLKYGTLSLTDLVDHLNTAHATVGDIFDYLFRAAWDILGDDAIARYLLLVASFFRDSASRRALAAIAELSEEELDSALKKLVEMSLLDVAGDIITGRLRYQIHPLTRAFASARADELPRWKPGAQRKWLWFFDELIRVRKTHEDASWWSTLDGWRNNAKVEEDIDNLLKAVDVAYTSELWQQVRDLAVNMAHLLWYTGHPNERVEVMMRASEAIDRLLEAYVQSPSEVLRLKLDKAWIHGDGLGWVYVIQQKRELAREHLAIGIEIAKTILESAFVDEDIRHEAMDAIAHAQRFAAMLELMAPAGNADTLDAMEEPLIGLLGECGARIRNRILCTLGQLSLKRGQLEFEQGNPSAAVYFQKACRYLQDALDGERVLGDSTETVWDLVWLGEVYLAVGDLEQARSVADEAMTQVNEIGDRVTGAFVSRVQGQLEHVEGNEEKAKRLLTDSHETFSRLCMNTEAQTTRALLAKLS